MAGKIIVAGATGFIGSALVPALAKEGYEVVALTRGGKDVPGARSVPWDSRTQGPWVRELEDAVALVNLAGEPISQRWTPEARTRIRQSRLESVHALGEAVRAFGQAPLRWLNASAIGYYGNRGDAPVTEDSAAGTGFLAETCVEWERAVTVAAPAWCPTTRIRIGVVLGAEGGALPVLARLARLGLGGPAGSGRQGVPWIHRDDLVAMIGWVLRQESPPPVVNGTAPNPVSNREFMRTLRHVVGRPFSLPAPAFGIQLVGKTVGPDADLVLAGAFVVPQAALDRGFSFSYPNLGLALRATLGEKVV
jgi:uncharacterized protein (TIGR01777 family)